MRCDQIVYHEDMRQLEGFDEIRKIPGFSCNRENRSIMKAGNLTWVEERNKNIPNDNGNIAEVRCVLFDILKHEELEIEKSYAHKSLQKVFKEIKILRDIILICISCKQIQDGKGFWHQAKTYLGYHTETDLSDAVWMLKRCVASTYQKATG